MSQIHSLAATPTIQPLVIGQFKTNLVIYAFVYKADSDRYNNPQFRGDKWPFCV